MAMDLEEDFDDGDFRGDDRMDGRIRRRMMRRMARDGRGRSLFDRCGEVFWALFADLGVFWGGERKKAMVIEALSVLYFVFKLSRTRGDLALEAHAEKPGESHLFNGFPLFRINDEAMDFLCETLRMLTLGTNDPADVRTLMELNLAARLTSGAVGDVRSGLLRVMVESVVAHASGYAPQVSVEFGRCSLPLSLRPSFLELEEHLVNLPPI
jgi:flagellar motor component MotA